MPDLRPDEQPTSLFELLRQGVQEWRDSILDGTHQRAAAAQKQLTINHFTEIYRRHSGDKEA